MSGIVLKKHYEMDAPIERVWQGLTDPEMVKEYFFGTELVTTLKKGDDIFFRGEWEGTMYEDKGKILEVDAPNLLKYSYWSSFSGIEDSPENYGIITYELESTPAGTILHIVQENLRNADAKADSDKNWDIVINGLKKLLES